MLARPIPGHRRSRRGSLPDDVATPRFWPSQVTPCLTLSFGFPDSPRQAAEQTRAVLTDIQNFFTASTPHCPPPRHKTRGRDKAATRQQHYGSALRARENKVDGLVRTGYAPN